MMKIAVMVNSLMAIGGIAKHALSLSREFSEMGHEVTVWAVEYDKEHCYPELVKGLKVRALRSTRQVFPTAGRIPGSGMAASLRSSQITYQDQRKLVQEMSKGYDLVNPHGNLIVWAAAEYKRKYGVPVVWMCNDFWPMGHNQFNGDSLSLSGVKHIIKKLLNRPVFVYDQAAVHEIDRIAVLSEIVKTQMMSHYGVAPFVIRKGVDVNRFSQGNSEWVRSHFSIPDESFLLLTVCALMPRRKLEDVINAIEILVSQGIDITYLIIGSETHTPEYSRLIHNEVATRHLEDHILFGGQVSEEAMVGCYLACDAFIWPADQSQSWGSAGMEAMASGKPVIVSKANGLAEILEDNKTGFLVPPGSPMAIADVLKRLTSDPMLAQTAGKAGQQLMREKYSWRNYAQHMLDLIQSPITGA